MSRNSITPFCAITAGSEWVQTFMPSVAGVAQAGKGLGAFSTCTRHIRQLAAMVSFLCQQKCGTEMPSLCATPITVQPWATATAVPSTSRFNILVSDIAGNQTLLVIDVILELVAKMLDEALDRQRGGVAQRAYGAAGDVVGHGDQQVEVFVPALPVLDAVHHAPQPSGPLAAWRALTAGLLEIEIRQP